MRKFLSLIFFLTTLCTAAMPAGQLVRVEVDTTGIFEISHQQLSSLGFDNPASVAVYGYGGVVASGKTIVAVPDELPAAAFMHTADGRLLFYGEADVRATLAENNDAIFVRNCFDTSGVYYLSDVMPESRAEYPMTANSSSALEYHSHIELIEREIQSPGDVGTNFHSTILKPGDSEMYTFPIVNYKTLPTGSMVMFRYDIAINSEYVTKVAVTLPDNVREVLNQPLPSIANKLSTRLYTVCSGSAIFTPPSVGAFDNTTVGIEINIASVFRGTYAAVDKAYIIYPRTNRLGGSELFLNFKGINSKQAFAVQSADSDAVVWNVTDPTDIHAYELSYDAASRTATGTLGHEGAYNLRLVAFNPAAKHRTPRICGIPADAALRDMPTPDYLIVTTATLLPAAQELAAIHRDLQGLDVAVVVQDDIFNEFSSGMRMPEGIRRFVKSLYDKAPSKLRHVLIYGHSEWDVRNILGLGGDGIPSYISEEPQLVRDLTTAFHSDQFFGMTSDDFTTALIYQAPQEVSVGRLPVSDLSTARAANEKSRRRLLEEPSAASFLHVVKFSDDGDSRAHFDYSEEMADLLVEGNAAITVSRADNHLYPWKNGFAREASRKLRDELHSGAGLMFYTGHGSATGLTAQAIYNVHFIDTEEYPLAPLAFLASCVTFPYGASTEAMVPRMVLSEKGGAIGAVGACRPVYLEQNRPLSNAFAQAYAAALPGDSGADLLRKARTRTLADGITAALGNNTLCFNYCGDPALPLATPEYRIEFTSDGDAMTFRAGEAATLSGRIIDRSGRHVSDFNGSVLVQAYDLPTTLRTLKRSDDDGDPVEVVADDRLLAEFSAPVTAGSFSLDVAFPNVTGEGLRKIVVTAVDPDSRITAAGIRRDLTISESDVAHSFAAPEINDFSAESECVSPSFAATAIVKVSALGLAPQQGLVKGLAVSVDGKSSVDGISINKEMRPDGTVEVSAQFRNLAPGPHDIVLRATDTSGAASEASLRVLVGDETLTGVLEADNVDPARENVLFTLNAPGAANATLVIVAADGATALCRRGCSFPFVWNLTGSDGKPVADGKYRAYVLLDADGASGSTENVEITVLKTAQYNKN